MELPKGKQNLVKYPDGSLGEPPMDGTFFIDTKNLGSTYHWDAILFEWVDHRGEIFRPEPSKVKAAKKCGCGAHALGVDKHSDYCDLYEG
jgi:hypothetical protein